jgi:hypothetical protein
MDQMVRDILSDVPTPGFNPYLMPPANPVEPMEVQVVEGNQNYMNANPPAAIIRIPPPPPAVAKGLDPGRSRLNINVPAPNVTVPQPPKEQFSRDFVAGVLVRDWRCTKELVRILRVVKKACWTNRSKDNIADAHDFLYRYCTERGYGKLANMRVADLDLVIPAAADLAFKPHHTDFLIHVANATVAVHDWSTQIRERFIATVLGQAGLPIWLGRPA